MVSRTPANGNAASGRTSTTGLHDALRILFRHRRKMAAFFLTTMTLVVLALIFYPRTYSSDARMFLRLGKESVGLDPTATLGHRVAAQTSRENEIETELEILRSRTLLEDVVARLGAEYVLVGNKGEKSGWMSTVLAPLRSAKAWLIGETSPAEEAVAKLSKAIDIRSPRRSSIIHVTSKGGDSEYAQRTLQAFLDAYMIRHAKANRTAGSYEFLNDQSQRLAEELTKTNEELRDTKNQMKLVSLEGHRSNIQSQTTSIESAILENQRALAQSDAKIAALQQSLTQLPEEHTAEETAGLPNVAADMMRNELYRVQIQEKSASSRYTSIHPHVIALRRQVAETEKILDQQEGSRSQVTRRRSPVHQAVQTELLATQATAASERARADLLKQQHDTVLEKIESLNVNEFRVTQLTRKADLIEASYRGYVANREQARLDQELELGSISNVNVVQPASLVFKPVSPGVTIVLLAGFFLAILGSVLLAFICEQFDPSLKTWQQVENELGVPVLFSVPGSRRHELLYN
jgi:uncharacterized protein involved in exopolysaccharide biosynthesis